MINFYLIRYFWSFVAFTPVRLIVQKTWFVQLQEPEVMKPFFYSLQAFILKYLIHFDVYKRSLDDCFMWGQTQWLPNVFIYNPLTFPKQCHEILLGLNVSATFSCNDSCESCEVCLDQLCRGEIRNSCPFLFTKWLDRSQIEWIIFVKSNSLFLLFIYWTNQTYFYFLFKYTTALYLTV